MTNKNNNVANISVKPVQPRYIMINEDIYLTLNIFERSVYEALRFQADYRCQCSDVQITVDELIKISKVKRSMLFYCLDSLENKHFLIRRINWNKKTWGKANEYEVAQNLNYFKPIVEDEKEEKNIKDINFININNGSYKEGVQEVDYIVQEVDDIVHQVDDIVHPVHSAENDKQIYKETYYPVTEEKQKPLTVHQMMQTNPLNLPKQMIEDWVISRKAKKSPVTLTAWIRINKQLATCPNPIEAFEECVAAGWISFKAEWVKPKDKKSFFDHDSIEWAKGLEQDIF